MFGIGSTELLVILVVALIVLGPKSLASASRALGKAVGEFRRVSNDFQRALNVEAAAAEEKEKLKAAKKEAEQVTPPAETRVPSSDPVAGLPADSPLIAALTKANAEAAQAEEKLKNENNVGKSR